MGLWPLAHASMSGVVSFLWPLSSMLAFMASKTVTSSMYPLAHARPSTESAFSSSSSVRLLPTTSFLAATAATASAAAVVDESRLECGWLGVSLSLLKLE